MKKIAANKNYQRLKQLWETTKGDGLCSFDEESQTRLVSAEERIRSLEIELVYLIRDLRNAIVAIEDLYQWRASLPDLDILNNIWGSFHSSSKSDLN
jgi:hypothetical protein